MLRYLRCDPTSGGGQNNSLVRGTSCTVQLHPRIACKVINGGGDDDVAGAVVDKMGGKCQSTCYLHCTEMHRQFCGRLRDFATTLSTTCVNKKWKQ